MCIYCIYFDFLNDLSSTVFSKLRLSRFPRVTGPAGTGKTESVKALGHQLGRFVLVFNCDETFDFQVRSSLGPPQNLRAWEGQVGIPSLCLPQSHWPFLGVVFGSFGDQVLLWAVWYPTYMLWRCLMLPTSFFLGQFFKEMAYLGINKCYEKDFF